MPLDLAAQLCDAPAQLVGADRLLPVGVAALDAAFGTDDIFAELYAPASRENRPDQFRRRRDSRCAHLIEEYAGQIVPGLVSTADCARAQFVIRSSKTSASRQTVSAPTIY
ncbi:hypothetical protein [Streptomyces sulphureus]|uniref:hypothetical protein n=1 Tax=Streptomyces sulphureus TaxID=47758 RepID=UPI00037986CA|nr:hypothetical protein [Streptomyces sulphureus]